MIESSSNLNEDELKVFFGAGKAANEKQESTEYVVDSNMNARPVSVKQVADTKIGGNKMNTTSKRNILVIGTGNGGCNIAAAIKKKYPENIGLVLYNTSQKGMKDIADIADRNIIIKDADGSGKDRTLSKKIFKSGAYKSAIEEIREIASNNSYDYILLCTTTDGGTGGGISPAMAKFIRDNIQIPVIVLGVFPAVCEDAVAQYNSIEWFGEISKSDIPYIIFDNDGYNKMQHNEINEIIANHVGLIVGEYFSDSELSQIDNQDLSTMIVDGGGRICLYLGDHPDAKLDDLVKSSHQPEAESAYACGVFLKGPESIVKEADPAGVRQYFGAMVAFNHLEISNRTKIGVILSGCKAPDKRLLVMKNQYDRMMAVTSDEEESIMDNLKVANPLKKKSAPVVKAPSSDGEDGLNLDALDW